jgi:hypothetical protein
MPTLIRRPDEAPAWLRAPTDSLGTAFRGTDFSVLPKELTGLGLDAAVGAAFGTN